MTDRPEAPATETTECLFCHTNDERPLLRRPRPRHVVCRRCGLVYQNPRPSHVTMSHHYEDAYWEGRASVAPAGERREWTSRSMAVAGWIASHVTQASLVVDVGASDGEALACVREQTGCRVIGIEPSGLQAARARERFGLEVLQTDLFAAELETRADVVVLSHVLEHVDDPRRALAKCHSLLTETGKLWIEVPNILHPNPAKRLSRWLAPEHNFYFSPGTLDRLLRECGFEPERVECATYVRLLAHEARPQRVEWRSEYRQVRAAIRGHELHYWPRFVVRRTIDVLRAAGRRLLGGSTPTADASDAEGR